MLKYVIIIFILGTSPCFFGQIEVTASDFPGKGDTVRYTNTTDFSIDYQSTGTNYNWDFSALIGNSQTLLNHNSIDNADMLTQGLFGEFVIPKYRATYYLPATAIPFGLITDFIDIPIEDFYRFFRKTASQMTVIGLSLSAGGFGLGSRSDTIEVAYEYPMVFGQNYTSRGYTYLDMSFALPAQFKQYRQRNSEVDGFGTIETPYGTFDALRIHHVIDELDSIYFEFDGSGQWIELPIPRSHEYEWWTNEENGPILKVITNEIGGGEQVTSIQYRDIYRADLVASIEDELPIEFNIFPNPATDFIQIQSNADLAEMYVVTMSGSLVFQSAFSNELHVANLQGGAYNLILRSKDGRIAVKRFVKE